MSEPEPQPRRKLEWYHFTPREAWLGVIGFGVGAALMALLLVLAG